MMLNKQMLAVAFAAGASFLVGCSNDTPCKDVNYLALEDASEECVQCAKDAAEKAVAGADQAAFASAVDAYEECGVDFTHACKGMAKITAAVADDNAATTLITNTQFDTDATKNTEAVTICTSCYTLHKSAQAATVTDPEEKALEACGVEVDIAA